MSCRVYNKCKLKETFPSLAFKCSTNHGQSILGIAPVQYSTRSNKHIVRLDPTVHLFKNAWYKEVKWAHFDVAGERKVSTGVYLICNGNYLHWKALISPYQGAPTSGLHGHFNRNLESVRKDVECTFGILKKCWWILGDGLHYIHMSYCEKIFTVCAMLLNMMIYSLEMRQSTVRVGHGLPIVNDEVYIEEEVVLEEWYEREFVPAVIRKRDKEEASAGQARRDALAGHIEFCKSLSGLIDQN